MNHDHPDVPGDVFKGRGNYTMSDYRRFVEVFSPLLLAAPPGSSLLHETCSLAWGYLRRISENHMKAHPGETHQERLARIAETQSLFLAYAQLAVKVGLLLHSFDVLPCSCAPLRKVLCANNYSVGSCYLVVCIHCSACI